MFTGIIEEVGEVLTQRQAPGSYVLGIKAHKVLEDVGVGDSIAVDGVCLTVIGHTAEGFDADVMPETLQRSTLASLNPGAPVNLERAMPADGRFGGHIVSGHIDGIGRIVELREDQNAVWLRVSADEGILRYIVEKGSVALDGVSLTVARLVDETFEVSLIPHTRAQTNLQDKAVGDTLNIECDIIAKYVERLCNGQGGERPACPSTQTGGIDETFLRENGF
ncbi:MAG: riboflavin synthase [Coriobacteriaceae bacterium]|nr:riboflavin synthase [Coriobacteriaceae bacterium]